MADGPTYFGVVSALLAFAPLVPAIYMFCHFIYVKGPIELTVHTILTDEERLELDNDPFHHGLKREINLPQFFPPWEGEVLHVIDKKQKHHDMMEELTALNQSTAHLTEFVEDDSRTWDRSISRQEDSDSFSHFERFVKKDAARNGIEYVSLKDRNIDFRQLKGQEKVPGL